MFRLLYPSSVFELYTYVGAYHQPLSLKQSFLTFNLMMIVVIWGLFRKGLVAGSSHWEGSDICIGRRYCRFQIYCQPRYFSTDNAILPGNFVEFLLNFTHHIDVVHKVGKDRNCKHPMFKSASLHPSLFDFHSAQRYNVKTDTTHTSIIKHPKGCSCSNLKPVLVTLVRVWHVQVGESGAYLIFVIVIFLHFEVWKLFT